MDSDPAAVTRALREWLCNERRLGVTLWATLPVGWERARSVAQAAAPAVAQSPAAVHSAGAVTPGLFVHDPSLPPVCARELSPAEAATALNQLDAGHVRGCTKCRLHTSRTQTVFGVGNPRPELVFVGEGPGADEDAQGEPFVGRAGQLLTRMIAAMTLTREQVYICNVVKCRPPDNRTPADDEMETCSPYLFRQLAILRPKAIVALGRPATQTLLATKAPITRLRGQWGDFPPPAFAGVGLPPAKLMPTYHPAYLLRNPPAKSDVWKDLQEVMRLIGLRVQGSR
jgi:uracil-DNA glycosylase family 4